MSESNPMRQVVDLIGNLISDIKNKKKIENAAALMVGLEAMIQDVNALYAMHEQAERESAGKPAKNANLSPQEKKWLERLDKAIEEAEKYEKGVTQALENAQSKARTEKKKTRAPGTRKKKFKSLGSDQGWIPM